MKLRTRRIRIPLSGCSECWGKKYTVSKAWSRAWKTSSHLPDATSFTAPARLGRPPPTMMTCTTASDILCEVRQFDDSSFRVRESLCSSMYTMETCIRVQSEEWTRQLLSINHSSDFSKCYLRTIKNRLLRSTGDDPRLVDFALYLPSVILAFYLPLLLCTSTCTSGDPEGHAVCPSSRPSRI